MKNFMDIADVSTEKKMTKLQNALNATGSLEKYNWMTQEVNDPRTVDYPKYKMIITPNYLCSYENKKSIVVISLNDVTNVYRSNITNGQYDFARKHIELETGFAKYAVASTALAIKEDEHEAIIRSLKNRIMMNGGY